MKSWRTQDCVWCPSPLTGDEGRHSDQQLSLYLEKGGRAAITLRVKSFDTGEKHNRQKIRFHKSPTKTRKHKETFTRHFENEGWSSIDMFCVHLDFHLFNYHWFHEYLFPVKACLLSLYGHVVSSAVISFSTFPSLLHCVSCHNGGAVSFTAPLSQTTDWWLIHLHTQSLALSFSLFSTFYLRSTHTQIIQHLSFLFEDANIIPSDVVPWWM